MIKFRTLNEDGTTTHVRHFNQSAFLKCPHVIMMPDHYREDETCRCNDPDHTEMVDWGYRWLDGVWADDEPEPTETEPSRLAYATARERLVILFTHISDTLTGKEIKDTDNIWESYRLNAIELLAGTPIIVYLNDGGYSRVAIDLFRENPSTDRTPIQLTSESLPLPKDLWPKWQASFNNRLTLIINQYNEQIS